MIMGKYVPGGRKYKIINKMRNLWTILQRNNLLISKEAELADREV